MTYRTLSETPTITAGAYSAGDAVGGMLEFENICTAFNNSYCIKNASITDKASQDALLYLVLFDREFTPTVDNAAFTVSDADLLHCCGILRFEVADYLTFATNSIARLGFDSLEVRECCTLKEGGTSLFGQLMVVTSTPTYVSTTDLTIKLVVTS